MRIITTIDETLQWQIIVKFDNGMVGMYLLDGRHFICDKIPTLCHVEYRLEYKNE